MAVLALDGSEVTHPVSGTAGTKKEVSERIVKTSRIHGTSILAQRDLYTSILCRGHRRLQVFERSLLTHEKQKSNILMMA